jgi:hypothetical protein
MLTIEEESRRSMSPTRSQINWIVVVVVAAQVGYIQTTNQTIANFASDEDFFSFSFQLFWVRNKHKGGQFHCMCFTFFRKNKRKRKNCLLLFSSLVFFILLCYEASASW